MLVGLVFFALLIKVAVFNEKSRIFRTLSETFRTNWTFRKVSEPELVGVLGRASFATILDAVLAMDYTRTLSLILVKMSQIFLAGMSCDLEGNRRVFMTIAFIVVITVAKARTTVFASWLTMFL